MLKLPQKVDQRTELKIEDERIKGDKSVLSGCQKVGLAMCSVEECLLSKCVAFRSVFITREKRKRYGRNIKGARNVP